MTTNNTPATREETLTADDGGRILLTFVAAEQPRSPIVYMPGMFTGRPFWLSDKGIGLAAYLAEAGFPGLIVQRREAGCGARPGLEEHLRLDLPRVQARVEETWGRPAFWMGHSFGGVLSARATAETLDAARVAGLVLFGSQFEVGKRPLHPPFSLATRGISALLGRFPARRLGLGPRDEPPEAMHDAIRLVTEGRRRPELRQALRKITAPALAISGLGDKVDPTAGCEKLIGHFASTDKRFIAAGRRNGFEMDYDHPGIVVSKPAQQEIWPLVRDWLLERDVAVVSTN